METVKFALSLPLTLNDVFLPEENIIFVKNGSPHAISQTVSLMKDREVSVIIGPPKADYGELVEQLSVEHGIRFLSYYLTSVNNKNSLSYQFYPSTEFGTMIDYLLNYWRWNKFFIIYSKTHGVQNAHFFISKTVAEIIFIEVEDDNFAEDPFIKAGKKLRNACNVENCWKQGNKIVIELDEWNTKKFLQAALKLGLINAQNWFYLLAMSNIGPDLNDFRYNAMRFSVITQFRENNLRNNHTYVSFIKNYESKLGKNAESLNTLVTLHDVMQIIKLICSDYSVDQAVYGLTGSIRLNNITRIRSDAEFYVIEMGVNGTAVNTGIWKTNSASLQRMLSMTDKILPNTHESMLEETKTQRLLKVVSIEERPYVVKKTLPNGRIIYEGFCIDLLNRLSEDLNFEYKLTIVSDGKYGDRINGTKEWDGMIGEILKGEADAAVAPITITANRLEVVDFTDPFLQLGISMLMRVPEDHKASNSILSFFSPLSWHVWTFLILVTILSVFAVVTVTILSPTEDSKIFNGPNSIWYLICILLRAGSGYNCRSVASRLISTAWWTFSLILIAQYTANFAAVLTIDRKTLPFNSFEELSNQTEYHFGTIQGGSTMQFFMYSRLDPFKKIWQKMRNSTHSVFVESNQEGVAKVLAEKECEGKAVEIKRSLGMDKISGIFAMLGIGLLVAFIVATTEKTLWGKIKKKPRLLNQTEN